MTLVVITGGARSGKSAAGQRLAQMRQLDGSRVTVAVFGREEGDAEMAARIQHHRSERPAGFETLEVTEPHGWIESVAGDGLLLVDCLGTLLGLVMEREWEAATDGTLHDAEATALPVGYEDAVTSSFDEVVAALVEHDGDVIVVTNEVGMGVVPEWASARLFRDLLGRANRSLVAEADAAYLAVAGRMIDLKQVPSALTWPTD